CAVAGLAMAAVRVGEAIPAAVDRAVGAAVAVVGVVRYALGGLAVVALLARVDLAVAAVLGRPAVGRAAVAIDVVAIVADLVSRIVEVWVAIRVPERLVGVAVAAALHPLAVRGAAVAAHRVAVVTLLADLHVHDAVAALLELADRRAEDSCFRVELERRVAVLVPRVLEVEDPVDLDRLVEVAVAAGLVRPAVGRATIAVDVVAIVADLVSGILEVGVAIRVPD